MATFFMLAALMIAAALAFVLLGLALAAGGLILAVLRPQRVQGKG